MVVVPEFLIRRIYKKGSLKKTAKGIELTLKNVLGPGEISGFNYVKINDDSFEPSQVKFITMGEELSGEDVSEENPVKFRLGQEGTLVLVGKDVLLKEKNSIVIEVMNPEAGRVKLSVEDTI